jgi:hypothetical protein
MTKDIDLLEGSGFRRVRISGSLAGPAVSSSRSRRCTISFSNASRSSSFMSRSVSSSCSLSRRSSRCSNSRDARRRFVGTASCDLGPVCDRSIVIARASVVPGCGGRQRDHRNAPLSHTSDTRLLPESAMVGAWQRTLAPPRSFTTSVWPSSRGSGWCFHTQRIIKIGTDWNTPQLRLSVVRPRGRIARVADEGGRGSGPTESSRPRV